MARNRQRARERKQRENDGTPDLQQPLRQNVPGSLDHASGAEEIVEASIVAGAGGVEASGGPGEAAAAKGFSPEAFGEDRAEGERPRERAAAGPRQDGNAVINFLRASWAELQRVQWPDRRQVGQATAVVLGFVALAGAYLGVADWAAQKLVNAIL